MIDRCLITQRNFCAAKTSGVAEQLNQDGFACLEGAISLEWLDRARASVTGALNENGNKFFSVVRPSQVIGSPFSDLASNKQVRDFLADLSAAICPNAVHDHGDIYDVLRVIAGPKGESGSCQFHYDASVITMLVPIFMPQNEPGMSGELVVFPNSRQFRNSAAHNLLEKACVQNRWAWRKSAKKLNYEENSRLLLPGNAYLFIGYRTYHGNLPCAPNSLRATLLMHFGDPHGNSPTLRSVKGARRIVESLRRKFT